MNSRLAKITLFTIIVGGLGFSGLVQILYYLPLEVVLSTPLRVFVTFYSVPYAGVLRARGKYSDGSDFWGLVANFADQQGFTQHPGGMALPDAPPRVYADFSKANGTQFIVKLIDGAFEAVFFTTGDRAKDERLVAAFAVALKEFDFVVIPSPPIG